MNIIDPFKKAFPEYFKIPVEEKDEFYDILNGYYEANQINYIYFCFLLKL